LILGHERIPLACYCGSAVPNRLYDASRNLALLA